MKRIVPIIILSSNLAAGAASSSTIDSDWFVSQAPSASTHRPDIFELFNITHSERELIEVPALTEEETAFLKTVKFISTYVGRPPFEFGATDCHYDEVDMRKLMDMFNYFGRNSEIIFTFNNDTYTCSASENIENPPLTQSSLTEMALLETLLHKKYSVPSKKNRLLGPFSTPDSEDGFMHTAHSYGNIVLRNSQIINILDDSIQPGDNILEIGAAEGHQTFKMLSQGAFVTAIELNKIASLSTEIYTQNSFLGTLPHRPDYLKEKPLETITAKFPNDLALERIQEGSYDTILLSHVSHYLTGDEFRAGIGKIKSWLKPGGRFYFQTLTPYSNPYSCGAISFEQRAEAGDLWPGYSKSATRRGLQMPQEGHPISPSILERELRLAGFEIKYINYASFRRTELPPISYQELEQLVKQTGSPEDLAFIESKFKTSKQRQLLEEIKNDAIKSYRFLKTLDSLGIQLETMLKVFKGKSLSLEEERILTLTKSDPRYQEVIDPSNRPAISIMETVIAIAEKIDS